MFSRRRSAAAEPKMGSSSQLVVDNDDNFGTRHSSSTSHSNRNGAAVLPLHHTQSIEDVFTTSMRQSYPQQQTRRLSKRPIATTVSQASTTATASLVSGNNDMDASHPLDSNPETPKRNEKKRSFRSSMEAMKNKLFSVSKNQNDGNGARQFSKHVAEKRLSQPQQQRRSWQQGPSLWRSSSTGSQRRRTSTTNFVTFLGAMILISCASFVYLASTISETRTTSTDADIDRDAPQPKQPYRNKNHHEPPEAENIISNLSTKSSKGFRKNGDGSRESSSNGREYPRVLGLVSREAEYANDNMNKNNHNLQDLNATYTQGQFHFQYHRIQIPRDKLPPARTYESILMLQNRTWDEVLDLPVADGLKDNSSSNAVVTASPTPSPVTSKNTDVSSVHNTTTQSSQDEEPVRDDVPLAQNDDNAKEDENDTCRPMADWMTATFCNCNSIHEIDMRASAARHDQSDLALLGQGWFRGTWKYSTNQVHANATASPLLSELESTVVLKTLRMEREFLDEYFDLHRRDAVAMERLTFSPFVMDVYGYCGQSALNEFADGVAKGRFTSLEQVNRAMRGKENDPSAMRIKLQLATSIAIGLAHVHNVYIGGEPGHTRRYSTKNLLYGDDSKRSTTGFGNSMATMSHYDFNPRNIQMMSNGKAKLNDFNIAEFLTYNTTTNQPCGFRSRLHEPWWRAPEEMDMSHTAMVTEKVDVYALGNVLFHILTTHAPRGKMIRGRMDAVRALVQNGTKPIMLEPYANGEIRKNRITKAFVKAMDLCYEADPSKRGTSIQVARVLHKALKREEDEIRNAKKAEKPH